MHFIIYNVNDLFCATSQILFYTGFTLSFNNVAYFCQQINKLI